MASHREKPRPPSPIAKDVEFGSEPVLETPQHSETDTATNSSDEFDWDDDEDFKTQQERTKAKRGRALWMAFMKLSRAVRVLLVSVFVASILITPFIVVKLRFKGNPVSAQVHVWSIWLTIAWAAACATYLLVDAIPWVILSIVVLFGGQVERLKLQVELVMAVSGWLKLTLDISWAWISLSVIRAIDHPPGSYWVIINRVMQALFAASTILLVEKLFLQFVAINFHQKALAERIEENRLGLKALDRLSNAHPVPNRKSPYVKRGHKSPSASVDLFGINPRGHKLGQNSREGSPVEGDGQPNANGYAEKFKHRRKERRRKSKAVTSVIVDQHEAFALFDKDGNGDITKKEMREAVQRIYRERKSLASSLKDVSSVVAKLDAVLLAVALVGIIFVCLLIFNRSNTLSSLVPLATIILGFSFVFGHSAQTLFESVKWISLLYALMLLTSYE
ncbi:hypothetical protein H0H87_012233 [Tephrocybe sp. NHM501043]|nr:hypothetical protein H0H87_012233 [Tephrocybe sp. NHM501043]